MLSLIFLAKASDILENAFHSLTDSNYSTVIKRVNHLCDLDFEKEASKKTANQLMWAVFAYFSSM